LVGGGLLLLVLVLLLLMLLANLRGPADWHSCRARRPGRYFSSLGGRPRIT
jgi:hypothetical protein